MAKPITTIQKHIPSEEEIKQEKLEGLQTMLADNEAALHLAFQIVSELHASGMLEAAVAMLQAKEKIGKIAVDQVSREPVTAMINNMMSSAGVLTKIDAEQTTKLLNSVVSGMQQAEEHLQSNKKIGVLDLLKVLNDPDINRAVGFGIHFLKGVGKGLKEE